MACGACQKQRQRTMDAMRSGDVRKTVKEAARGVGMMTGILPKGAAPGPGRSSKG